MEPDLETREKKTQATSEVPAALGLTEEALLATKDIEQEEHGRRDAMFPVARSCASQMQKFSGRDWLEPMTPGQDWKNVLQTGIRFKGWSRA